VHPRDHTCGVVVPRTRPTTVGVQRDFQQLARHAKVRPVSNEDPLMKTHIAIGLIVGALLGPGIALAVDSDTDRDHPTTFVKDSAITTKVKAKLTADHMSSLARVHVDTDKNGEVWLSGTVESEKVAANAVQIAKSTEGVRGVHSDIKVKAED